ncbi:MAG: hypothetical protein COU82_00700 [Candidatus Portnoybacteria bacterium CG10_big_fil_rev_8_21_14_0_10_38_18]|uniref:Glycosyltransferase 2-like domain-containing protein n=1 Tax=Candidatus Portnoybacteria bacterium CG10_big_fil_rev_8_21_14_0_10_38_18 TaxID=1974813 RepID=A0A2M8KCP3_9BACT|nr:MAG: hypothetical protein COU82_00700 [Candidatus Portnoybacteria bacterium CG10_big_fil_rev_8_21_14_0_10_38_18]
MIKLSIIITNYKTPELLDLCLKATKETVSNLEYEIIVADSESEEKNQGFLKERYPEVKFISFKKIVGYSKTINTGIKNAGGEYILILNADIIVLDNAIFEMIKFMEKNPDVGIVGPQLLDFTNNIQASCFANPSLKAIIARRTFLGKTKWGKEVLNKFTINDRDKSCTKEVDWVQGSAIMVRKDAIDKVGLFDERFFMYFEDADWCRRFRQNGYKVIYYPESKMAHYYHRSSKKWGGILDIFLNKYTRLHIISALKYFSKYHAYK